MVEIDEQGLADALAEMIGRDEEMMNEAVGFPEGEEAKDGSVGAFGEVDEFAFGIAGEVIELEVRGIAPCKGGAARAEVEVGECGLVGGKGGTEEHGCEKRLCGRVEGAEVVALRKLIELTDISLLVPTL